MQRRRVASIAIVLVVVFGVTTIWLASAPPSPASGSSPEMHLGASGPGVTCFGSSPDVKCMVSNVNAAFSVQVLGSCCNPGSASGFQSELYGVSDLGYVETTCTAEVTMTPKALCLGPTIGQNGQVAHGNATTLVGPVLPWSNPPDLVSVALTCGGIAGIRQLVLTAYDLDLNNLGSQFWDTTGTVVDVKRRGTAMLDLGSGGDPPTEVPMADALTIQCGVGHPGDASCNGVVGPMDAVLILQFNARLLQALGCPGNADANLDGTVNPIDAVLILQFDAGLLHQLPP